MSIPFRHFNVLAFTMRYIGFEVIPAEESKHDHSNNFGGEKYYLKIDDMMDCGVMITIIDGVLIPKRKIVNKDKLYIDQQEVTDSLWSELELEHEKYLNLIRSELTVQKFNL